MAVSWEFIESLAQAYPQCKTVEGERLEWCVKGKAVAWERADETIVRELFLETAEWLNESR